MSHAVELEPAVRPAQPRHPALAGVARVLEQLNRFLLALCMLSMVVVSIMLTYAVVERYLFKLPTDWQDDATVFLLIGATFFSCSYVQSMRGHIGIEAVASLLSPKVNAVRLFLVDVFSLLFCMFFTWKSWTLSYEAWRDGQTTASTLAPPLGIPYTMMALGMTLLCLQILLQLLSHVMTREEAA